MERAPPRRNRRFLESRLGCRVQELAYGGLKPATLKRLEALGEALDGGKADLRRRRANSLDAQREAPAASDAVHRRATRSWPKTLDGEPSAALAGWPISIS